ncbi:MAG: bifunctional glycosyltransferase/class I SAM-dependent methyltransferase [Ignavibacteria bacterium]|nr:bifunctional glycosyltransferase/class I SAM-dependent methyltransferase [Ignavibacteria bacterium]
MRNNKKIGILIVAYNAATTLNKVLDRIPANVYEEIDEIAVFDDASKDNTYMLSVGYKELKKLSKLHLYLNDKNLGYGGNQKKGFGYFKEKGFDVVVLLHGDGQYAPEILQDMYSPITDGDADVVLGSRMMTKYGGALKGGMPIYKFIGNRILSTFQNRKLKMNLTEFHSGYRAYSLKGLSKLNLTNATNDFHFDTQIIIKAHHNNLKITEIPIPTYYGDEICYVNGMKYARNIFGTTNEYMKTVKGKLKSEVYSEYYIPYPLKLYPFSSHKFVIDILNKKDNRRILDIGCGDGLLAEHISKRNEKVGVDFISPSENTIKNFSKYFQYDLNKGLPEKIAEEKPFDYILFLDILEHLLDYESILRKSGEYLSKEGEIIISLPNFVNIYVRLNVLIGRLPLADKGILDRTHLHMFTYGNIVKMLRKNGFEITGKKVTPIPIIEVLPDIFKKNLGYILNYFLHVLSLSFKRTFGYQFIFICKVKK